MTKPALTLIGAGRMGSALMGGWLKGGFAGKIDVVDPKPSAALTDLAASGEIRLNPPVTPAQTLIVAVKPQVFASVSEDIRSHIGPDTTVLSIMAGVSLETLEARLGTPDVARAMPNTPGLVGKGVTLLCFKHGTDTETQNRLRSLLEPLGTVEGPISEDLLPAATAISGCGPAYGFLLAEVMAAAGIAHGLEEGMAHRLARKTVEGAGALMEASPETAATLRQNVTSPNGVTQAALEVLMHDPAMPSLFVDAIAAAIARDRELSQETA